MSRRYLLLLGYTASHTGSFHGILKELMSRKHHEETNHKDEGGAVKGAEPFGQLCVKVFVM